MGSSEQEENVLIPCRDVALLRLCGGLDDKRDPCIAKTTHAPLTELIGQSIDKDKYIAVKSH